MLRDELASLDTACLPKNGAEIDESGSTLFSLGNGLNDGRLVFVNVCA